MAQSYSCGEHEANLGAWLQQYLTPAGRYYSRDNFHSWAPGEHFDYCNIAFGLLGHIVETVAERSFSEYCADRIFRPLGMQSTSFGASVSAPRQAIPYTLLDNERPRGRVVRDNARAPIVWNGAGYVANCLYTFPTIPDGLLRTSVRDFARFLGAMLREGRSGDYQMLRPNTVQEMFQPQFPKAARPQIFPDFQGIAWYAQRVAEPAYVAALGSRSRNQHPRPASCSEQEWGALFREYGAHGASGGCLWSLLKTGGKRSIAFELSLRSRRPESIPIELSPSRSSCDVLYRLWR